jgi:AraC-like DNA-binding protein
MEWLTRANEADRPFGSWAEDLADAFVPLEPRKIAEQPFQGAITRTDVASIQISRVEATRHVVMRLRSHIARSVGDVYFVNLQLDGVGRYTQRGHEQICGPGDLAIVDTTEPFEIANCRNFSLFCFAVPRELLPAALAERPRLRLSATEVGRALSRTLRGHAELCLRSEPNSGLFAFGAQHVVDLIAHAPGVLEDAPPERAGFSVVLSMMLDHIDRELDDPELSAATLALKFRCSQRYVHKLFAATGRSVGEHIATQRVLVCTRNLLDPAYRRATIAQVAFDAGFRDISYFNRLFKRSTGLAPREFRRTMSPRPGGGAQ